jgi:hypothetical protein
VAGVPLIGALLGNPEGVRLPGLLREKKGNLGSFFDPEVIKILSLSETLASLRHTYLGSFFLDPEDIRKLSVGAMWKEQGSFKLVQNKGHKGPVLRPRCIGPGRARTQISFYSILTHSYLKYKLCISIILPAV